MKKKTIQNGNTFHFHRSVASISMTSSRSLYLFSLLACNVGGCLTFVLLPYYRLFVCYFLFQRLFQSSISFIFEHVRNIFFILSCFYNHFPLPMFTNACSNSNNNNNKHTHRKKGKKKIFNLFFLLFCMPVACSL